MHGSYGYLSASGENSDTGIRFFDPSFLYRERYFCYCMMLRATCCGGVNYAVSLLCSGQVSLSYKLVVISLIVWRVRNMATSSSRPHADCMLVQLTASVTSLGYWTPRVWSQQQQQRQTSPSSTIQVSYSRYAQPVRNYEYQRRLPVLSFISNTAWGATVTFTDV